MATETELMNMDDDAFEEAQNLIVENTDTEEPETKEVAEAAEEPVEEEVVEEDVVDDSEETTDTEEPEEVTETDDADNETTDDAEPEESQEDDTNDSFSYEKSYNELMKTLNVSGKEVQIKSQEDMRNLASMGIDYSRKMRDIKPLRAVGETLTKAGLIRDGKVNEAELTRLLDISSGNKEALIALMNEKGFDPLDLEMEDSNYVPQTEMVDESQIAIQDVERELINRGSVDNVVQELSKLDDKSKQFFNESPDRLLKLEEDISSGAYNEFMGKVQYERTLGRLNGVSDIEAYIQFAQAANASQPQPEPTQVKPTVDKKRKKAASASRRAPVKKQTKSYDFVNMSDEEFEKHMMVDSLY
jgi:hypothetical protein